MKDKTNKGFWQRTAFLYTWFMKKNERTFDRVSDLLRPYIQPHFRVLELACGTGQITFRLCKNAAAWVATDFSPNMLEQARKNGTAENLAFQQADATALSFESQQFDAVVISNCLHIMPEPDKALSEIHRVLKADGLLFAPTFVYDPRVAKAKIRLLERIGFRTYNKWTAAEVVRYIEHCGFQTEAQDIIPGSPASECVYVGRKERGNTSYVR